MAYRLPPHHLRCPLPCPLLAPQPPSRSRPLPLIGSLHLVGNQPHRAEVSQRLHGRSAGEPRKNDFLDVLLDDGKAAQVDRDTLLALFTVNPLVFNFSCYD